MYVQCILFKHIKGFAQTFVHYIVSVPLCGTSKTFYRQAPYGNLSLGKYKLFLFPHARTCNLKFKIWSLPKSKRVCLQIKK